MLRGIYSSATGMEAHKDMHEMIADNLANANTNGYKSISHSYKSFADSGLVNSITGQPLGALSHGTEANSTNFNFAQATLRETGNALDLAVQGEGFFPLQLHDGRVAYTRNGHFTMDQNGFIVNQHGEYLLDQGLSPIFLGVQGVRDLTILRNGTIMVNGSLIAQLSTYAFPKDAQIERMEGDKFLSPNPGTTMINTMNINNGDDNKNNDNFNYNAPTTTIVQGFIENSNVSSIKTAADMVQVMRGYEANQKALKVQTDSLQLLMDIGNI